MPITAATCQPWASPPIAPGSFGVHHAIAADPYRGQWGRNDPDAGRNYAADVKSVIDYATPGQIAAFIAESVQGVGGTVVFPDG
jgi:alanine-glyoxylate transaminase/(R)-3-amino-2-methylpropionate-pyruvate transaminase